MVLGAVSLRVNTSSTETVGTGRSTLGVASESLSYADLLLIGPADFMLAPLVQLLLLQEWAHWDSSSECRFQIRLNQSLCQLLLFLELVNS